VMLFGCDLRIGFDVTGAPASSRAPQN
jgi:hypothetical protein